MTRLIVSLLAVGVLLGVGPAALAQAPIKIGFHAGLTGPAAADGVSGRTAAELAVEQINRGGGINGRKLELVVYDDQGKPDQVVPIANKLIGDDKVKAVVSTGFSGPTKAAAPKAEKAPKGDKPEKAPKGDKAPKGEKPAKGEKKGAAGKPAASASRYAESMLPGSVMLPQRHAGCSSILPVPIGCS